MAIYLLSTELAKVQYRGYNSEIIAVQPREGVTGQGLNVGDIVRVPNGCKKLVFAQSYSFSYAEAGIPFWYFRIGVQFGYLPDVVKTVANFDFSFAMYGSGSYREAPTSDTQRDYFEFDAPPNKTFPFMNINIFEGTNVEEITYKPLQIVAMF